MGCPAASHEAGHTMGLNHDGTATAGYWQGNSANYGAIMGAGEDTGHTCVEGPELYGGTEAAPESLVLGAAK